MGAFFFPGKLKRLPHIINDSTTAFYYALVNAAEVIRKPLL